MVPGENSDVLFKRVKDVVDYVVTLVEQEQERARAATSSKSFGFWFRGQVREEWGIEPGIFRQGTSYNEASMCTHFRLRAPQHRSDCTSEMDWLALMQHYNLPTRLVDWTENLLVALFFATWNPVAGKDDDEREGRIFVLAARKLNQQTTGHFGIYGPEGFHTVVRATQARADTFAQWQRGLSDHHVEQTSFDAEERDAVANASAFTPLFAHPIAVFPHRNNHRLNAQAGVFTLHGGKQASKDGFVAPVCLRTKNAALLEQGRLDQQFLWSFKIAGGAGKRKIRDELEMLGIHVGTMFPDLEYQSRYLQRIWDMTRADTTEASVVPAKT